MALNMRALATAVSATLFAAYFSVLLAGSGCVPGRKTETTGGPGSGSPAGGAMSDDVFDKVRLGTLEPSAATPKVDDDFTGIRITMPAKVSVDELARVPLCGVWSFDGETMGKFPRIEESLVYLARNVASNETATGNFRIHKDPVTADDVKPDPASRPAAPSGDEPEVVEPSAATVRGYFNYNLGRFWTVPERPGKWRVHLVLHGVQSNEVEFEVVK